jgi:hypothetical protein
VTRDNLIWGDNMTTIFCLFWWRSLIKRLDTDLIFLGTMLAPHLSWSAAHHECLLMMGPAERGIFGQSEAG